MRLELHEVTLGGVRRSFAAAPVDLSRWSLLACVLLLAVVGGAGWARPTSAQEPPATDLDPALEAFNTGRYDQLDRLLEKLDTADPAVAMLKARAATARGRYAEAEALLRPITERVPDGEAAFEYAQLQLLLGRRAAAVRLFQPIVASGAGARAPLVLARAARAAQLLGRFRDANAYFRAATAAAPGDPSIQTAWGELFLEKYNQREAIRSFQLALKANPNWAPAQLGMARAVAGENPPAAMALAEKALTANPVLIGTHLLIADLSLDEGHRDRARTAVARALEINPSSLPARALVAALAYVEGRDAEFKAEVDRALAINPTYGEVYRVAGDLAARNYRFDDAVGLARRAIALDPDNVRAHADLGMHLLRTGDEPGARRALDQAFRADPYDVVTFNLLSLLDTLDKFESVTEGNLTVRFHPDEAAVLREYAVPLAREALTTLGARYGFQPAGPILVEMFPRHDDFAVRNLGLPGMIGALGACFGRVVTMDSPRARPPGTFLWGATLWHELAHVVTLQMSNQRVPRWLTEGISVYEEKRARPDWGREMELAFASAFQRNEILTVRDLNGGFTNPKTIGLAYYEASLLVEHLIETFGEPALHKLLRTYGEGLETEAALKAALGTDFDQLQASFSKALEGTFGALRRALQVPEGASPDKASLEALTQLAADHPGSYPVLVAFGRALRGAGLLDQAVEVLERAAALVPIAIGQDSPRAMLAEIAIERNDRPRAARELEALLTHDADNVTASWQLASLLDLKAEPDRARVVYERIAAIDPYDAGVHGILGRLALARNDAATAAREFRAALAAGPVDRAAAYCDLAESYLAGGRSADAKRQTLAALEIAPTYERAQELLLKLTTDRP